jgi:hypothetical protein
MEKLIVNMYIFPSEVTQLFPTVRKKYRYIQQVEYK